MYCASRVFVEVTWCFVVSLSVCTSQGHVSVRVRWYSTHQAHWKEYREFCMSNWRAYTVGAHKPILAASSTTMFGQSHSESNHIKHYSFKVRWLFCQVLPIFSVKSRSILLLAIWIPIYRFYSSSFWGWAAESFGWVRNGKRPESQVGPRVVHLSSIWGFLKWGILKTMGFNTKMVWWLDDWGVPILGNLHMIQALPSNITLTSSTLPTTVCCVFFRGQGALKRWTSDHFEKLL